MEDLELLREYVERRSETAFAALVEHHAGLVYSAALRQTCDPHLAEEVTQAVFIVLAKKAKAIRKGTILTGWLFRTTRFAAADAVKMQIRRRRREQQAAQMQTTAAEEFNWEQIAPFLDEAVAALGERDRNAVLLRFFENKNFAEVGAAMGTNEEAARKRIARATKKLRHYFSKRGVILTAALITGTISANAVQAASPALIQSVTAIALAKGATASISTLTLIKGALKIMAWTKAKTAIVTGIVLAVLATSSMFVVNRIHQPRIQQGYYNFGFNGVDAQTVLDAYHSISGLELIVSPEANRPDAGLNASITMQNSGLTKEQACKLLEEALLKQAGLMITKLDGRRARVTYNGMTPLDTRPKPSAAGVPSPGLKP